MKEILHRLLISSSIFLTLATSIRGQIVPDNTVSTNVNLINNMFEITGGIEVGGNLFHSFQEFSVSTGTEAFFNNATNIENILSRVTGDTISDIDGLIRANGNANLFLINPAGIIFGSNSTLNIGGSFLGSSADSIVFPEGEFSATNIQTPPLLTINTPIGLNFGSNSGQIINRSQSSYNGAVNGLILFEENPDPQNFPVGLQVFPGKTIALIGGMVNLEKGNLSAPGGNIELGSVSDNSFVSINETNLGFTIGYEKVSNFQDILLSESIVDTTDLSNLINRSGTINLQGKIVNITNASAIFSINFGNDSGGEIKVLSSESINLIEDDANLFTLASFNQGNGAAGNIKVKTKNLSIVDGGFIASFPSASASSGEIKIATSDSIELIGVETDREGFSGISIQPFPNFTGGEGKNLNIETEQLIVKDGAQIGSIALGMSQGADVIIKASTIKVEGTGEVLTPLPDGTQVPILIGSAIVTQAEPNSIKNSGNLTIETDRLNVQNGGFISTSVRGFGQGGDLTINASESIFLSGTASTANLFRGSSGLFTLADTNSIGNGGKLNISTPQLIVKNSARVSADTFGSGNAGEINLDVDRLILKDGGQVRASSLFAENTSNRPLGASGTLTINANESIDIIGSGDINSETVTSGIFALAEGRGNAGSLSISTPKLTVTDGGEITAQTSGAGDAGDIILKVSDQITLTGDDSGILANTANDSTGKGGSILTENQTPQTISVADGATIAVNSDGSGEGGSIDLAAKEFTLNNGSITAETAINQGGNITLNVDNILTFENSGEITATAGTAQGRGDGGNVTINSDFILALLTDNTYKITAQAFEGNGGNIQITTDSFFGREFVELNASSEAGIDGDVSVDILDVDPVRGLTELPDVPIDIATLLARNPCEIEVGKDTKSSSFILTGRGGLPPNPYEPLDNNNIFVDIQLPSKWTENSVNNSATPPPVAEPIVEATAWVVNEKGNVELVSQVPSNSAKCSNNNVDPN